MTQALPAGRHSAAAWIPILAGVAATAILAGAILAGATAGPDRAWMAAMLPLREGGIAVQAALFLNWLGGGLVGTYLLPVLMTALLWWRRGARAGLYFLVASILSALGVQALKHLVGRARPEEILVHADYGSFPSGHTANAATIVVALALIFGRAWIAWVGAIYVVAMALSRTILGAHWLSDTIAGALLGATIALLVWVLWARLWPRSRG